MLIALTCRENTEEKNPCKSQKVVGKEQCLDWHNSNCQYPAFPCQRIAQLVIAQIQTRQRMVDSPMSTLMFSIELKMEFEKRIKHRL